MNSANLIDWKANFEDREDKCIKEIIDALKRNDAPLELLDEILANVKKKVYNSIMISRHSIIEN